MALPTLLIFVVETYERFWQSKIEKPNKVKKEKYIKIIFLRKRLTTFGKFLILLKANFL